MLYGTDRQRLREVFFRAWRRYRERQPVEGVERRIVDVALHHPEYHTLLDNPARHQDRDYLPETGETNPFLHMAMHLALDEQIALDQPRGICGHYRDILARIPDEHAAQHAMMECLGEAMWAASRTPGAPDEARYLACLQRLGGRARR